MKESKTMKFSEALYWRLKRLSPRKREEVIGAALDAGEARALSAPAEPDGETPVAGVEPEVTRALPERGELSMGSVLEPIEGSAVPSKNVWSTGRSGLGEPVEWAGALVHLPPDCLWFLSLDDTSRAAAVRASLARARDREAEREVRLAGMSNPEGVERPSDIPEVWEPVTVWVPPAEACWPVRIQDLAVRGLGIEKQPGSFDLEAFIAGKKAKAAKKPEGAQ